MKPRERGGVVDSRLNVFGVRRLKVADLSIGPSNVGANTYSTALVIGEKAAVLIAEELGIDGVCHLNPNPNPREDGSASASRRLGLSRSGSNAFLFCFVVIMLVHSIYGT